MKVLKSFTCKNKYYAKGSVLPDRALSAAELKEAQAKGLLEKPKKAKEQLWKRKSWKNLDY